jgi:hypothetical protein
MSTTPSLEHVIAHDVPAGRIEPGLHAELIGMARGLDGLGRAVPGSTEPVLDEGALRQFLQRHMPNLADPVLTEARNRPGSHLGAGEGTPIHWPELVRRISERRTAQPGLFSPSFDATLATYGLSRESSTDEVRRTISERIPNFEPQAIFNRLNAISAQAGSASAQPADDAGAVAPEFSVASFWNCMYSHFGWWAIGAVISVAIAFLAAFNPVTAAFAWGVFWFWFGLGVGLVTLETILNCLLSS